MSPFIKFIISGKIGDEETREQLANSIFSILLGENKKTELDLSEVETSGFTAALNRILAHKPLLRLTKANEPLATEITQFLLDFITKTKRKLQQNKNPFESEKTAWENFRKVKPKDFEEKWTDFQDFLQNNYAPDDLDTSFYQTNFEESFDKTLIKEEHHPAFHQVKEHLAEKWASLLFMKQLQHEMQQIGQSAGEMSETFFEQFGNLEKWAEAMKGLEQKDGNPREMHNKMWDLSKGNWREKNFDVLAKYARLFSQSKALQELVENLGRQNEMEEETDEMELQPTITFRPRIEYSAKSELVGITESDDLGSLLPTEIAMLGLADTEAIFMKKFAEKKLQTFDYQSKMIDEIHEEMTLQKVKKQNKGPIIAIVDTSGSMYGQPEEIAKTVAFGVLHLALKENRKCYLINFSDSFKTIELHDYEKSLSKLISFMRKSANGGNNEPVAMEEVLRILKTANFKKADILWISDFVTIPFEKEVLNKVAKARENDTRFHSLTIGNESNKEIVNQFDHIWLYKQNGGKGNLKKVV
ncbi:MAG: hypothetical protein ACKVTZ_11825 [Bacteroidia bacterium]